MNNASQTQSQTDSREFWLYRITPKFHNFGHPSLTTAPAFFPSVGPPCHPWAPSLFEKHDA